MSGAAAVKQKQKSYIRKFKELGALDVEHAINLNEAGIKESSVFDRMVDNKIFIQCDYSKFYLNFSALETYKKKKQEQGSFILFALFLVIIFYFLFTSK